MGRLTQEELAKAVEKDAVRGSGKGSVKLGSLHLAITRAYESGQAICLPDSKLFERLDQLDEAGMLTGYHITKTIELHVEARAATNAIFDRGLRLFTESPRRAPAIAN